MGGMKKRGWETREDIMAIKESWPEDGERSVMRSMESCWNGRSKEEGMGGSGGHVG